MNNLATGEQYQLQFVNQSAVITQLGATLRSYQVAGIDVITSFDPDQVPFGFQGNQLLPWPNRIHDGKYRFDDEDYQLPINEVSRNTALHGLAFSIPWQVIDQNDNSITQQTIIYPQQGWPGLLEATICHELSANGLQISILAKNIGSRAFPFGYGAHPYFCCPQLADIELTIPFCSQVSVDERLNPIELIEPTYPEFKNGALLKDTEFDTAFSEPIRQTDNRWRVKLASHKIIEVWADPGLDWLQIYTPPNRTSIAIEAMSCGPDAFRDGPTHDSMIRLNPGQEWQSKWGIKVSS